MIKLENVSTNKFIMDNKNTLDASIWYARRLLLNHNITDYQKLKDFLESGLANEDVTRESRFAFAIILLKMELMVVESKVEKMNTLNKTIELFAFDNLKSSQIDDKVLNVTDERNRGKVLLCSSPIMLGSGIDSIRKLSIAQIKHLAGHVDADNFKNCLLNLKAMTPKKVASVDKAIKFYDEQVVRQYLELDTQDRDVNLFFVNSREKKALAEEQISDIAEYIRLNAKECVWGNLTIEQKKRLLAIASQSSSGDMEKVKGSFIDTISRYTTLTELENGVLNEQEVVTVVGGVVKRERKKPIDRFIIK